MGLTLRLAWRNIWRNKRRTGLTILAIVFASALMVFFISIRDSFFETSINASVSVFQGHLQVQAQGYLDHPQMRKSIREISALEERLRSLSDVKAVSARALGFALASSNSRSYGVQVVGQDPQNERSVSTIPSLVREGRYLSDKAAQELVIGRALARSLQVAVGDEITLLGQGEDGSAAATILPVVGIFESGTVELDRAVVAIPLDVFQDNFSMPDRGHSIVIVSREFEKLAELKTKIAGILPPSTEKDHQLVVLDWNEISPGLKQAIELDMNFHWIFYSCLIIIVTFTVLNTFLMSILERTKEFGVMLALGMRHQQLVLLVLGESILLIACGIVGGIALGAAIVAYFGLKGFFIPGSQEVMKIWHISTAVWPKLTVIGLTEGPAIIFIVALLSLMYPAFNIHKLKPVDALRSR